MWLPDTRQAAVRQLVRRWHGKGAKAGPAGSGMLRVKVLAFRIRTNGMLTDPRTAVKVQITETAIESGSARSTGTEIETVRETETGIEAGTGAGIATAAANGVGIATAIEVEIELDDLIAYSTCDDVS